MQLSSSGTCRLRRVGALPPRRPDRAGGQQGAPAPLSSSRRLETAVVALQDDDADNTKGSISSSSSISSCINNSGMIEQVVSRARPRLVGFKPKLGTDDAATGER